MNDLNEFLKRFRSFDNRLFTDEAAQFIATCDQGGLYSHFINCQSEEDVNEYVSEFLRENPDF